MGSGQEIGIPVIRLLLLDLRATDIGDSLLDVEIFWVPLNSAVGYCVFLLKNPYLGGFVSLL